MCYVTCYKQVKTWRQGKMNTHTCGILGCFGIFITIQNNSYTVLYSLVVMDPAVGQLGLNNLGQMDAVQLQYYVERGCTHVA